MKITTDTTVNLTADRDINGNELKVGTVVRSFDFAMIIDDDEVFGMDLEGDRVAYAQGTIEAVGEDRMEGCLRYRIKVDFWARSQGDGQIKKIVPVVGEVPDKIYPPLNGTPYAARDHRCFGVVAVPTLH